MAWRAKSFWKQYRPMILIALAVIFGYSMLRHGLLTRGFVPAFTSTMRQLPILGSQFRTHHAPAYAAPSYAYSPRPSYHRGGRHHRGHGRRHAGRRHHRRHR